MVTGVLGLCSRKAFHTEMEKKLQYNLSNIGQTFKAHLRRCPSSAVSAGWHPNWWNRGDILDANAVKPAHDASQMIRCPDLH